MKVLNNMEQPTNSNEIPTKPNKVCMLMVSFCSAGQAGRLLRSLVDSDLESWRFVPSRFEKRPSFKR